MGDLPHLQTMDWTLLLCRPYPSIHYLKRNANGLVTMVHFRCGFTKSTNIQHEAIPSLLEFSDCHALLASETGNGKTLAMVVPIIQVRTVDWLIHAGINN